jgi:hypothetical protein
MQKIYRKMEDEFDHALNPVYTETEYIVWPLLIYCITFIANNVIGILLRNNTFLICLTSFYRTDPFVLL